MHKPTLSDYVTRTPVMARPDQSIAYARSLMVEHKIQHLPVLDGRDVVGVVSQRDLLVFEHDPDVEEISLRRVMATSPFVVDIATDLRVVAREMAARHIGSAVVTADGRVVAMFTTIDALRALGAALDLLGESFD